jgi:hypothetical protein
MLHFHLVENLLTSAPDDYMAQVTRVRSYSIEEIAERMLKRGTLLTKADILAVLEVYHTEIADIVSDGDAVTTPILNAYPSIPGIFNGMADTFDGSRHHVRINLNPGMLLREAVAKVRTEKVHIDDPIPYIVEVKDIVSGSVNETLTPGGVMQVRGSRLRFFSDKPANGVFLLAEDGTETRCEVIVENKPGRIIVMLPGSLSSGSYHLEVRTTYAYNGDRESKQLKIGRFIKILTV